MLGCYRYFVSMAALLWILPVFTPAAQKQKTSPDEYTISTRSDLVVLDVAVKDAAGGYVTGLARENFSVLEDGQPRSITHFANTDAPVTVGLVVDNSGSMLLKHREVIMAGLSFAAGSNPKDEFFVVNFNDRLQYGLPSDIPFTDKIDQLQRALSMTRPVGRTALYDAIASALHHLEKSTQEYRTLIVVSDGGDNVSRVKFPDLLHFVQASRATIYTIGLMDPADNDLNPNVLKRLASISGGEYFQPEVAAQVGPVFSRISNDIRHRYVLGYVPDEIHDRHRLRTVKVQVSADGRKLIVRSRTSYVLEPAKEFVATNSSQNVLPE